MKYTISGKFTIVELFNESVSRVCDHVENMTEDSIKNFLYLENIGKHSIKKILVINKIEIVKIKDRIAPWIDLVATDGEFYYEIGVNLYDITECSVEIFGKLKYYHSVKENQY